MMNNPENCIGCPRLLASENFANDRRKNVASIISRKARVYTAHQSAKATINGLSHVPDAEAVIRGLDAIMNRAQASLDQTLHFNTELIKTSTEGEEYTQSKCELGVLKYRVKMLGSKAIACGSEVEKHQIPAEDLAFIDNFEKKVEQPEAPAYTPVNTETQPQQELILQ